MRRMQPSVLTRINLWKECRSNFDCVRGIAVLGWDKFALALSPGNWLDAPCRRC